MKSRRVVITLVAETDAPLPDMKTAAAWFAQVNGHDKSGYHVRTHKIRVLEAQAAVVRRGKGER